MNNEDIHRELGILSESVKALSKTIDLGRKRNIKELDEIRDNMTTMTSDIKILMRTANMGAGAWKAVFALGSIVTLAFGILRYFK